METLPVHGLTEQPPGLAARPTRPLAPAIRTVWALKQAIFWGLLWLAALTYDVLHLLTDLGSVPAGPATVLTLLGGILWAGVLPKLRYKYWRFDLLGEELHLERGVFNRVRTVVPLRRIQHLDVSQDLLERSFALGKLIVHTAGAESGSVVVPGLRIEEAEHLRDTIKHYILDDAV